MHPAGLYPSSPSHALPPPPELTLRIGFARHCELPANVALIRQALQSVFDRIDDFLAGFHRGLNEYYARIYRGAFLLNDALAALAVLSFTERCARDMVEEVAEWSVLYAKELSEP